MPKLIVTLSGERSFTLESSYLRWQWGHFIRWFERKRSKSSYKLDDAPYEVVKTEILQIEMNDIPMQHKILPLNIGEFSKEKTMRLIWKRTTDA
mgnify:CR=1 FL=1